jgi:hypothetical protein
MDDATKVEARGLPAPTTDVDQGLRDLAEHGVAIHRGFLSEDLRKRLLDRLIEQADMERELGCAIIGGAGGPQDLLESRPGDTRVPIFQNVEFLPNKGRVFIDLMMDPLPLAYAKGVFRGYPTKVWAYDGLISRRGIARQKAHIDQVGVPPELSLAMPSMLNTFICLSDFEVEMGATLISPGSHLLPRPRWGVDEESVPYFAAAAKAGDAIIWEGRTWHRAGPHVSDKTRYAISLGQCLYAVSPQEVFTHILHDRVHETLTESELDRLGFSVYDGGYSHRIAPRHPFDRRTNCNRVTKYVPELRRG